MKAHVITVCVFLNVPLVAIEQIQERQQAKKTINMQHLMLATSISRRSTYRCAGSFQKVSALTTP